MCGSSAAKSYGKAGSVCAMSAVSGPIVNCGRRGRRSDVGRCGTGGDRGAPAFLPPVDDPRQNRQEDHHENNLFDVPIDPGHPAAEEVAGEQHGPYPEQAAEDVVEHEVPIPHLGDPRHDRRKRANDWHESRENDRLATMLFVELVGPVQVLLVEEAGVLPGEDAGTGLSPDVVADLVARDRGDRKEKAEVVDVEAEVRL